MLHPMWECANPDILATGREFFVTPQSHGTRTELQL